MLKNELEQLGSHLLQIAFLHQVAAGGALAVDREAFSTAVTEKIEAHENIELIRKEVKEIPRDADAVILASGPLTSDALADALACVTGSDHLSFYDASAPIVMADSLDHEILFRQSRHENDQIGDYLNAPFTREEYEHFIHELCSADRVIRREFETQDLFQACQPIEEIARKGIDAPRFGSLKPVGLINPQTGHRPWAVLQLRAENAELTSYNLVGFQTNLTFPEQGRVFRMIPGLQNAEFARYGVMHRNTFVDAPRVLDEHLLMRTNTGTDNLPPLYCAGQLGGTEGYTEALMSGLWSALSVYAALNSLALPSFPQKTAFGALLAYATDPDTKDYQPMHVNFGIMPPFETKIRNKKERYAAYAHRGKVEMESFRSHLVDLGIMGEEHHG